MSPLKRLRRPAPAPYFHPIFIIFQIPPSGEGNQNLLPPPLKKVVGPNYDDLNTRCK